MQAVPSASCLRRQQPAASAETLASPMRSARKPSRSRASALQPAAISVNPTQLTFPRAAGRASQLAAPADHQQHGRRSHEQHRLSNHGSVRVQFLVEREHLRRNAEQRRQLYGASHFHSVCGRQSRGHAGRDLLDAWRYSSPGSSQRHRASRLGNRHQPGANGFHAAGPWTGQRDANRIDQQHQQRCRNGPRAFCPAAVQPRSEHLRLRSRGRSQLLDWEWCSRPAANGVVTGALTVSSSAFVIAAAASLTGTAALPVRSRCSPCRSAFRRRASAAPAHLMTVTLTNNGSVALGWPRAFNFEASFSSNRQPAAASLAVGAQLHRTGRLRSIKRWSANRKSHHLQFIAGCGRADTSLAAWDSIFLFRQRGNRARRSRAGRRPIFTINLATMSGSSGTFTFACSSLPANSACTFNPASESVSANATGSVTVQIATGLSSTSAQNADHRCSRASHCFLVAGGLAVVALRIQAQAAWCFLHGDPVAGSIGNRKLRGRRRRRRWSASGFFEQQHAGRHICRSCHGDSERAVAQDHAQLDGGLAMHSGRIMCTSAAWMERRKERLYFNFMPDAMTVGRIAVFEQMQANRPRMPQQ